MDWSLFPETVFLCFVGLLGVAASIFAFCCVVAAFENGTNDDGIGVFVWVVGTLISLAVASACFAPFVIASAAADAKAERIETS